MNQKFSTAFFASRKTITQAAADIGVSRQTVYNWLRDIGAPSPESARRIADVFGGTAQDYMPVSPEREQAYALRNRVISVLYACRGALLDDPVMREQIDHGIIAAEGVVAFLEQKKGDGK